MRIVRNATAVWFPTLSPCPHRAVLRDATPRSLVLLDEMGKGTEVLAATAISAALLRKLADRSGNNVIFATHTCMIW